MWNKNIGLYLGQFYLFSILKYSYCYRRWYHSCFFIFFLTNLIKSKRLHSQSSDILITIGIGFTFLGIFLGLIDFDANDVENSIPKLINGIKTAFSISIFAIFGSIFLKLIEIFFFGAMNKENKNEEFDIAELIKNQEEIILLLKKISEK